MPPDDPEFAALLDGFSLADEVRPLVRGIVVIAASRISDSCGFGVPRMELTGDRDQLVRWSEQQATKQGPDWKARYMATKNVVSIDGLPGYEVEESRRRQERLIADSP